MCSSVMAMEVTHVNCTWVRPETALRGEIPLTIFDRAVSLRRGHILLAYTAPTAPNTNILLALSRALSHYPKLAGKLSDHSPLVILDDDAGVPVIETSVSKTLAGILPLKPSQDLTALCACPYNQLGNPLLFIQLNNFCCGGLVIGLSISHRVADGTSISNFVTSWSQLVLGEEPHPLPTHDQSMLMPRNPPMPQFPHLNVELSLPAASDAAVTTNSCDHKEKTLANIYVHYTPDFIRGLKQQPGLERYSTFQLLLSYLWKKVTIARKLDLNAVTRAKIAVNGRLSLGASTEYFGNLFLFPIATAKVKDLVQSGIGYGASLVKEAVSQVDMGYFQSFIDFGELIKDHQLYPLIGKEDDAASVDLRVSSWMGFSFNKAAVGGRAPCGFVIPWLAEEGGVIISPPCPTENGGIGGRWADGVDVLLALVPEHAEAFKEIADCTSVSTAKI